MTRTTPGAGTGMQAVRQLKPQFPDRLFMDGDAEEAVLAMMMLGGESVVEKVLLTGLRDYHFFSERYGRVFSAMQSLVERNQPVDTITTRVEYERLFGDQEQGKLEVELLVATAGIVGNSTAYAERVMDRYQMRVVQRNTLLLQQALNADDKPEVARCIDSLNESRSERRRDSLSPVQWAEVLAEYLGEEQQAGFIPMPFPTLTHAMGGGMQTGEMLLISGYTNHGKSVVADQMLDMAANRGLRAHLYMTEMTAAQRGLRLISRRTGIPFGRLRSRALDKEQWVKVTTELQRLPYGCSIVSDWDIEDVSRDALRARYDLVVIDLIHGFRYDDERGLDHLSKSAQRLARVSTTKEGWRGCAVVIVAHLSGGQMVGSRTLKRPKPGLQHLKGSTSLSQDPDFVMFVWQQDDDHGHPTGEGEVYIPKARSGENEVVKVRLNPRHLRFEVAAAA